MSATTLTPRVASSLVIVSRPPLPKSLLTQMTATVFALTSFGDVVARPSASSIAARTTCGRVRVAVLGELGGLAAHDLGMPACCVERCRDLDRAGEARPEERHRRCRRAPSGPGRARRRDWTACRRAVISILRPRMPPSALISATARSAPFLKFVPTVAPPPDSSPTLAILIGPPVWANATPPRPAAMATAPAIFHAFISDVLPLAPARTVSGSLAAPLPPFLARDGFFARRGEACPKSCPGATQAPAGENRIDPGRAGPRRRASAPPSGHGPRAPRRGRARSRRGRARAATAGSHFRIEVRFMKSSTPRPEENRAERAVGRTWFGPPT